MRDFENRCRRILQRRDAFANDTPVNSVVRRFARPAMLVAGAAVVVNVQLIQVVAEDFEGLRKPILRSGFSRFVAPALRVFCHPLV